MFGFNVTFWVQIFRMRNFYFHYLNLQKFKQFVFCQFFKKWQCFWLKFGFTEYFNLRNFCKFYYFSPFLWKSILQKNWNRPSVKVYLAIFFWFLSFNFLYHKTLCFRETFSQNFQNFHDSFTQFAKVYPKKVDFFPSW